jgi:hypothetical protein
MRAPAKSIPKLTEKDKQNFCKKTSKIPDENGCLNWIAYKNKKGYGTFAINRKKFLANRVAYFIRHGHLPENLLVCHKCDNPSCVNQDHLFLGDDLDNCKDKISKGRSNPATGDRNGSRTKLERRPRGDKHHARNRPELVVRGERSGAAKLTRDQVEYIKLSTLPQRVIAREFGVSKSQIGNIRRGESWIHLEKKI